MQLDGHSMEKIKPYRRICSRFEKLKQSLLQLSRFCCIVFTDVPQFKEGITISALAKPPPIKPSRTARKAVSQPTSIWQPTLQAGAYRSVTKALCAVQAPRRLRAAFFAYFFLLLKKSKSPKASKATNEAVGLNALDKQCLFLIHP